MDASHNPHDRLVKLAFGRPAGARALLQFALPPAVLNCLDLESLRLVSPNIERADLLANLLHPTPSSEVFGDLLRYVVGTGDVSPSAFLVRLGRELPRSAEGIMKTFADQLIDQGREEGRVLSLRAAVVEIVNARFGSVPTDVARAIDSLTDPDALRQRLVVVATAQTLEDVRAAFRR